MKMKRRSVNRLGLSGQTMVEGIIVVSLVLAAALVALNGVIKTKLTEISTHATDVVDSAATEATNITVGRR